MACYCCTFEGVKIYRVVPGEFNLSSPNFLLRQLDRIKVSPSLVFIPRTAKLCLCFMAGAGCCRWHVSLEESLVCRSLCRKVKFAGEVFTTLQCVRLPRFPVCVNQIPKWFMGDGITKHIPSLLLRHGRHDQENQVFVALKKRVLWACLARFAVLWC